MSTDWLGSTIDPDGRTVIFDAGTRDHLVQRRRRHLVDQVPMILDTVSRPEHREDDAIAGRERFYRYNPITERWLRVVVDFSEEPGVVVTALAQHTDPRPKP